MQELNTLFFCKYSVAVYVGFLWVPFKVTSNGTLCHCCIHENLTCINMTSSQRRCWTKYSRCTSSTNARQFLDTQTQLKRDTWSSIPRIYFDRWTGNQRTKSLNLDTPEWALTEVEITMHVGSNVLDSDSSSPKPSSPLSSLITSEGSACKHPSSALGFDSDAVLSISLYESVSLGKGFTWMIEYSGRVLTRRSSSGWSRVEWE